MKAEPEFKGYNVTQFDKGNICEDIICRNILRQSLELEHTDIEIFYPHNKWIRKNKKEVILGSSQREVIDKLNKDGYMFKSVFSLRTLRRLKQKGYLIEWFIFKNNQQHNKLRIDRFIIIYYVNKRREAVQAIYNKYPQIMKCPNHFKKFEVPIMKNLNKLGTIRVGMNRDKIMFYNRDIRKSKERGKWR